MGESIELKEYFQIFKKRAWIIILITSIAVISSAIVTLFLTVPVYQAETTIMMNNKAGTNAQITQDDMDYSRVLGETYRPILKSRKVAQKIKKNLNLDIPYGSIIDSLEMVSVSGPVMKFTVQHTDPAIAQSIANEAPSVFRAELKRITKVDGVEVIDEALRPGTPISPNKVKNITMAGIIGIVISIFVVFLLEYLDNKIKTPMDVEGNTDMTMIGVVPMEDSKERKRSIEDVTSFSDPKSQVAESYRNIRTNLQFSNLDKSIKTLCITSSKQNEGKSTIISNMAVSFASLENKKVLLLDCDLRNPTIHRIFGVSNTVGLTDVLIGHKNFIETVQTTQIKNLNILPTGAIPPNPAEMLNSNKMKNFLESIKDHYDYILIDCPPIGIVADAGVISTYSDGTIMVVGSNEVETDVLKIYIF